MAYHAGRIAILLTLLWAMPEPIAHYGHHGKVLLPDSTVTPGVVRTTSAHEICMTTFRTGPFRNTTQATKKAACAEYGVKNCPHVGTLELDHLLPLELGGLDDVKDLWPQPSDKPGAPGWQSKDKLENWLKKRVCSGKMSLADAQKAIMTDWYAAYLEMEKSK